MLQSRLIKQPYALSQEAYLLSAHFEKSVIARSDSFFKQTDRWFSGTVRWSLIWQIKVAQTH